MLAAVCRLPGCSLCVTTHPRSSSAAKERSPPVTAPGFGRVGFGGCTVVISGVGNPVTMKHCVNLVVMSSQVKDFFSSLGD